MIYWLFMCGKVITDKWELEMENCKIVNWDGLGPMVGLPQSGYPMGYKANEWL